ncbi:hypothetical protein LINGRAHAP2_LOCUS4992 [Linum grandiflorum]
MSESTRNPSRRRPLLSSRRLEPPSSNCSSCRRNQEDQLDLARYFAALSLLLSSNSRPAAPNPTNPLLPLPAASSQRLIKTAAASPHLTRGHLHCFNGDGPSDQRRRPRKVSAAGSDPFLKPQVETPKGSARNHTERSAAGGSLQKQRSSRPSQSRFQGTRLGLQRSSVGTGSGTGVFHPLVENKTKADDAAQGNLLVSGKHRRRGRFQAAAAAADEVVEGKRPMKRVAEEEEEEEDCYYHLPPEIDFLFYD